MFLDIAGTLASLLATWFYIRIHASAWLLSLLAIGVNGYLYFSQGIYADGGLEVVYLFTTLYGWQQWKKTSLEPQRHIKTLSLRQWHAVIATTAVLFAIIYTLLTRFTHSTVATLDALTAALSLTAQALMCFKYTATWLLWLTTDVIYAGLYLKKDLPFHVLLMGIYLVLGIIGYRTWATKRLNSLQAS